MTPAKGTPASLDLGFLVCKTRRADRTWCRVPHLFFTSTCGVGLENRRRAARFQTGGTLIPCFGELPADSWGGWGGGGARGQPQLRACLLWCEELK